jgi:hypothetical protein
MNIRYLSLTLLTIAGALGLRGQITTLADLQNCIGQYGASVYGYGSTCQLASGTYHIDGVTNPTLQIGRSNIVIEGTEITSPLDTTLQRTGNVVSLMSIAAGLTNVTIAYLAFDGNRFGVSGLSCLGPNAFYYDLNLSGAGLAIVEYVDFINAPATAVILDGAYSVISFSNIGVNGALSAGRSTGLFLYGTGSVAEYNNIQFAGTSGISVEGSSEIVYSNTLVQNRYETPDNDAGGQLYLDQGSSGAFVAANDLNDNYWITTGAPVNGCDTVVTEYRNVGIEGYGYNHGIYDNYSVNNQGPGMGFGGTYPTGSITISSTNPWNSSDITRYIGYNYNYGGYGNYRGAIWFPGSQDHFAYNSTNIAFNDPYVIESYDGWGIYLDHVVTATFTNNACMNTNSSGNITTPGSTGVTLPSNYTNCP